MMIRLKADLSYTASGDRCDALLTDLETAAEEHEGITLVIAGHHYEVEIEKIREVQA